MSHTFRCDNCDADIFEACSNVSWDFPVEMQGYAFERSGRHIFCGLPCASEALFEWLGNHVHCPVCERLVDKLYDMRCADCRIKELQGIIEVWQMKCEKVMAGTPWARLVP